MHDFGAQGLWGERRREQAMHEPDDFGLSPVATLAHVGDTRHARQHQSFWHAFHEAVRAVTPRLRPRPTRDMDASDAGCDSEFEGLRHVRVGCRVLEPDGRARAGLVALHGYESPTPTREEEPRWAALRAAGVRVLLLRVRGYAGSRLDSGDWTTEPHGWLCRGLDATPANPASPRAEDLLAWSLPQGVADVVHACRALLATLPEGARVSLAGESFGGALAVLAGAALTHSAEAREHPERVVVGLPSLGDWPWRLGATSAGATPRCGAGAGRAVRDFLTLHASREEELVERLRLFDTVVHAPRVRAPALVKLALRDDVVPAPTASAVFNALGSDPACKWRFVAPYGHFDGGLRNARRHALFDRCADAFLDPRTPACEALRAWEGLMEEGERGPG